MTRTTRADGASIRGFKALATASTAKMYHKRADGLARAIREYTEAGDTRMVAICRHLYSLPVYADFRASFLNGGR